MKGLNPNFGFMFQAVPGFGTEVRCVRTVIFHSGKSGLYFTVASLGDNSDLTMKVQ